MRPLRSKDAHARRVRGTVCILGSVLLYNPMTICAHGAMLSEVAIHSAVMGFFEGFIHGMARLCSSQ